MRFDTTTTVIITVGNQGTANTVITRTYLDTSSADMQDVAASSKISVSGVLVSGSKCTVTITSPSAGVSAWASGETYYFNSTESRAILGGFQQACA